MPYVFDLLVLGLGNRLMSDDAVGPIVIDALAEAVDARPGVHLCDGGTLGLSLLPEIETARQLIVVDAARMGLTPGTLGVFEGPEMDRMAARRTTSAHELALGDLLGAAALNGRLPARRALVAVEPAATGLGLSLSPPVAGALEALRLTVLDLVDRWRTDAPPASPPMETVHG